MYLTFAEYTAKGGALTQAAFNRYEAQSAAHITRITHARIVAETPVRDSVKNLAFELVELLSSTNEAARSGYKSYSNGAVSATYKDAGEYRSQVVDLAKLYLTDETTDDVPLMYAGVIT